MGDVEVYEYRDRLEGYELWGRLMVSPEDQLLFKNFRKDNGAIDWLKVADSLDDKNIDELCTPKQAERIKYFKQRRCSFEQISRELGVCNTQAINTIRNGIRRALKGSQI